MENNGDDSDDSNDSSQDDDENDDNLPSRQLGTNSSHNTVQADSPAVPVIHTAISASRNIMLQGFNVSAPTQTQQSPTEIGEVELSPEDVDTPKQVIS